MISTRMPICLSLFHPCKKWKSLQLLLNICLQLSFMAEKPIKIIWLCQTNKIADADLMRNDCKLLVISPMLFASITYQNYEKLLLKHLNLHSHTGKASDLNKNWRMRFSNQKLFIVTGYFVFLHGISINKISINATEMWIWIGPPSIIQTPAMRYDHANLNQHWDLFIKLSNEEHKNFVNHFRLSPCEIIVLIALILQFIYM